MARSLLYTFQKKVKVKFNSTELCEIQQQMNFHTLGKKEIPHGEMIPPELFSAHYAIHLGANITLNVSVYSDGTFECETL
jgi:hypothetical protein